ncbi:MAG: ABC transporter permease [Elusimicrobia bacterium]|nr:ABC transporter permease [Elusimicrobiota bacterium]
MSAELFIALRYLKAKRKGLFSMITTIIGIAGVAIGVAALIVTLSIMNGFQSDIKKKIVDAQAHIIIYGQIGAGEIDYFTNRVESVDEVEKISHFVFGQAILTFKNRSTGVVVKGFDTKKEFQINSLEKSLIHGNWFEEKKGDKDVPGIVLGEELAKNIGAWVGDSVILVSPKAVSTSIGIFPKMKKFHITGLIRTGYYEFDSGMAYTPIEPVSDFFNLDGGVNGMGLMLSDIKHADKIAGSMKAKLGLPFVVKTYADMNRTLFSALKLEKFIMTIILGLIILVATLNIASNLLLMSVEKMRDIGILMSIGAKASFVRKIFLLEGNLVALSGIVIGVILGISISLLIAKYPVVQLPADIYYITKVPVQIRLWDVLTTILGSYVVCMLSAVYPAIRAAAISPVDAVRYG